MGFSMRSKRLALASAATLAVAQDCPSGTAAYTGYTAAAQTVEWVKCPYADYTNEIYEPTLECGTIQIPIDWTDKNSKTMTMGLVRVPANNTNAKSIVYNPGGPGASGISVLVGQGQDFVDLIGGEYNIITFDPRGTGQTTPYYCPYVDEYTAQQLGLYDAQGLNATYQWYKDQGVECAGSQYKAAGELVGTAFVARDIDTIMQSIGEDGMIRYWGQSYGTLLGATTAAMFPDKIDRMVLDGNINPTDYYHGLNAESVDDVDGALSHFFEACVAAGPSECALADGTSTAAELEATLYDALNGLQNGTYVATDAQGNSYTYDTIKTGIFTTLKAPSQFPQLASDLLQAFSSISSTGTTSAKRATSSFDPALSFVDNTNLALDAITCGDWDDINASEEDFQSYLKLYTDRSKFGGDQMIQILFSCSTWNVNAKEQYNGVFEKIQTKTPVLFINGHYDPVTPHISAVNSSSGFVGSGLLSHDGAGHCANAQKNSCVFKKMATYLDTGNIPDVSQYCKPDAALFSTSDVSSFNSTNIDPSSSNSTTTSHSKRFAEALEAAESFLLPRKVETPSVLLDLIKRETVRNLWTRTSNHLVARASGSATCTPTVEAGKGDSSSSSSNQNAAAAVTVGTFSLISVVAASVFALL